MATDVDCTALSHQIQNFHGTVFLGKASYVRCCLLITAYLLIRNEYHRNLDAMNQQVVQGMKQYSQVEMLKLASAQPIGLIYTFWFLLLYSLAIRHRRKTSKHARYMLATALTLTGPTVDRIIGIQFKLETIAGVTSYIISFLIIDLVLLLLLYVDYKDKRETKTLGNCLVIYIGGQLLLTLCQLRLVSYEFYPDPCCNKPWQSNKVSRNDAGRNV
jgi:hypothetical protein